MSQRLLQSVVRGTLIVLAGMAVLPVRVQAAEPKTSSDPNAVAVKKDAVVRPATSPPRNSSTRPGGRTPASFTPQMPFSEAIDILRNCTNPPLNIVVLWRNLDGAGIYRDTAIGIDGLPGLRVGQYLDMLVLSLSAGTPDKVGYIVDGGVITIGTTSALPAPRLVTRVYDISDLVAPPANYRFSPMGYGGLYGNQMMGLAGGYSGGLGTGYGMGLPSMSGSSYGTGISGLVGSSLGDTRPRASGSLRGR
jgi:hypothetical protein